MKISEIKEGMSLKYEALTLTSKKEEPYTLVGMFMELPKSYKVGDGKNYQKAGKFIGYIKGSNQLQELKVYFYNSDKEVAKELEFSAQREQVPMNINRLSATRMPKVISDHLKKLHKQYQGESKRREEIKRLEDQSNQANEKIYSLTRTIANSLKKEVKPDYKGMPEVEFYNLACVMFSKHSNKNEITDVYVTNTKEKALTIDVCLKDSYNPAYLYLQRKEENVYEIDYESSYKKFYKLLTVKDRKEVDLINNQLSKVKGLSYKVSFNSDVNLDYKDHIVADYTIRFNDKANLEDLIKILSIIF